MEIEYKVIDRNALLKIDSPLEKALNKLGEQGWELITIDFNGVSFQHQYYFKRKPEGSARC